MKTLSPAGIIRALIALRTHFVALILVTYLYVSKRVYGGHDPEAVKLGLLIAVLCQLIYIYTRNEDLTADFMNGEFLVFGRTGLAAKARFSVLALEALLLAYIGWAYPVIVIPLGLGAGVMVVYSRLVKKVPLLSNAVSVLGSFFIFFLIPLLLREGFSFPVVWRHFMNSMPFLFTVFCLVVFLEIKDIPGDLATGYRTLPVMIGRAPAAVAIGAGQLTMAVAGACAGDYRGSANNLMLSAFMLGAARKRPLWYFAAALLAEAAVLLILL